MATSTNSPQLTQLQEDALHLQKWMLSHFEQNIENAVRGTKFPKNLPIAIACQESFYKIRLWIDKYAPEVVLARCVFDANGDAPKTSRSAFPMNSLDFQRKYGEEFTNMLVMEANKMRAMPQVDAPGGYKPANFLYKGYGIFQYDLQFVNSDKDFFFKKQWYDIDACLKRLIGELNEKAKVSSSLRETVRRYNGSGAKAEEYADNVMAYLAAMGR
jgi:hypothetical protein